MKLLLLLLLLLSLCPCRSQNVAIAPLLSRPEHEFHSVPGCPTNWPVIVDRLGTNTVSPFPGRVVTTEQDLSVLYSIIGPAFTNWHRTTWQNYLATNNAAGEARRQQILTEQEAILGQIRRATNIADFGPAAVPLVLSNLVRLRQLEERIQK